MSHITRTKKQIKRQKIVDAIKGLRGMFKFNGLSLVHLILLLLMLLPLLALVMNATEASSSDLGITEKSYVVNTLYMVILAIFFSLLLGVPSAFLMVHYNFWGRGFLQWALLMPIAVPSYINAFVLIDFVSPETANDMFWEWRVWLLSLLRSRYGAGFVSSLSLYPYIYLFSKLSFMTQSGRIVDVSRVYGFSMWKYFFRGALPLAVPAILSGLVLVVLESIGEYGVPVYFGFQTITTNIFILWDTYGDTAGSVQLSLLLLSFILLILWLGRMFGTDRREMLLKFASSPYLPTRKEVRGGQALWMLVCCGVPVCIGFILPVVRLLLMLFYHFDEQLPLEDLWHQVKNSLFLGLFSGFLVALISLCFLGLKGNLVYLQRFLFGYGYGLPSLVLALGVLILLSKLDNLLIKLWDLKPFQLLGGGYIGLLYVYVVRFMRVGMSPIERSFHRIGDSSVMVSKLLGLNRFDKIRYLYLPSMVLSIFSAMLLVMVDVFKELPATQLLRPLGFDTLSTGIFQWGGDEMVEKVAFGSLLMILLGGIAAMFLVVMLNMTVRAGKTGR